MRPIFQFLFHAFNTAVSSVTFRALVRQGALILALASFSIGGSGDAQTLQDCKGYGAAGNWECTPTPQIVGAWNYTVHVPGIASSDAADSFENALPSLYTRLAAQAAVCGSATRPPDFIFQDVTWFEFHSLVSHTHWEHGQIRLAPLGSGCGSPQEFTAAVTMDVIRAPTCDVQKGWTSARVYDAGGVALSQFCMRPPKLDACPGGCPTGVRGNPVGLISGNKIIEETDYSTPGGFAFNRNYNSNSVGAQSRWTHNLYRRILRNHLAPPGTATTEQVWLHRGSSISYFLRVGGVLVPRAEQRDKLVETPTGYTYTGPDDTVETFDPDGTLLTLATRDGRGFSLTYIVDTIANTKYANATDVFGRVTRVNFVSALPITADENYWVSSIVTPMGSTISYEGWPNLTRVVLEDGTSRRYFYAPAPGATTQPDPMVLTGAEDEKGWAYADYTYNTAGQVLTERHQAAAGVYVNNYAFNPGLSYTDPRGTTRSYSTALSAGAMRITGYSQPCTSCGPDHALSTTYDANGNVASRTDFNNKKTCYAYDLARNLETTRVEGLASGESCTTAWTTPPNRVDVRKTVTTWHATYRLPATITEPAAAATIGGTAGTKTTVFNYDTSGNLLQKDVTAPKNDGSGTNETRSWKWTYNTLGQVLTARDPLDQQTTTVYYPATDTAVPPKFTKGDVQTITNAAGHITTFNEYDKNGRLTKLTDANGLVTTMTYYPRGWLSSRAVNNGATTETTTYTYDNIGQLTRVTLPDGSKLFYAYDDAHRMVGMSDQSTGTAVAPNGSLLVQLANLAGNKIIYTLDNMGNRVREDHYDPNTNLTKRKQRAIDSLNRLKQDIGGTSYATAAPVGAPTVDAGVANPPANAAVTQYGYDNNNNLTSTLDPLGRQTNNEYDALNRLAKVIDPYNGASKPTQYTYDSAGNLVRVSDPQGLATDYTYNGHNNLITQTSPDSGTTKFTYNANGNVVTKFDAQSRCSLHSYDELNRLVEVQYFSPNTAGPANATDCANVDPYSGLAEVTHSYSYDSTLGKIGGPGGRGRLSQVGDEFGSTIYLYDKIGRVTRKTQTLAGATNPNQLVDYAYNSVGQMRQLLTPSGQTISYVYGSAASNAPGKVIGIQINGTDVIKGGVYEPLGPSGGWSWGNHNGTGLINQHLRVFDLDYRPTAISSDPEGYNRNIAWDRGNRIAGITVPGTSGGSPTITIPGVTNALSVNQTYAYDALDRLTGMNAGYPGATSLATGQGILPNEAFTYDAIGNRLTRTATPPGGSAGTATYAYPNLPTTSGTKRHTLTGISGAQVNAYSYDATGNTLSESAARGLFNFAIGSLGDSGYSTNLYYSFDVRNRMSRVQIGNRVDDNTSLSMDTLKQRSQSAGRDGLKIGIGPQPMDYVDYRYNALGQRVQKSGHGYYAYITNTTIVPSTGMSAHAVALQFNARYVYDERGRLLGEYSPEGKLIQETIWLDDLPVATIRPRGSSVQLPLGIPGTGASTANNTGANDTNNRVNVEVFYVHPDHLGTPRAATRSEAVAGATSGPNAINKAVWRWDSDPFGTSLDNSNPVENPQLVSGTASQITAASFRVSNRFPGQVLDGESGKSYNYFRDYDPSIGRYTESDPVGLRGGLNTFGYALGSPLLYVDMNGKSPAFVGAIGLIGLLSACALPYYYEAMSRFGPSSDKFKHCWVSCRIANTCGGFIAQIAGLGKEGRDRAVGVYCQLNPTAQICSGGQGDWLDSWLDLRANQQCISGASYLLGPLAGLCGRSCEDCCRAKVPY